MSVVEVDVAGMLGVSPRHFTSQASILILICVPSPCFDFGFWDSLPGVSGWHSSPALSVLGLHARTTMSSCPLCVLLDTLRIAVVGECAWTWFSLGCFPGPWWRILIYPWWSLHGVSISGPFNPGLWYNSSPGPCSFLCSCTAHVNLFSQSWPVNLPTVLTELS